MRGAPWHALLSVRRVEGGGRLPTVRYAKNLPGTRVDASDPGCIATDPNRHSGHQTMTKGTDATVALATVDQAGPTGGVPRSSRADRPLSRSPVGPR